MKQEAFPTISIITPSFNQGHFLEQCISSILDQQYPNLQYIIIDGGSSDNSQQIIKKYASQLNYWVSEKDDGQSHAINKGLSVATGDIVAWLNADDFYYPNSFLEIARTYQINPHASFYFGHGDRVNEQGEKMASFFPRPSIIFNRMAFAMGINYVLQPSTFMNSMHLKKAGYLDVHLKYGMDSDLWLKLSALAEPVFVPAILAASREYETTKTATGAFGRVEELRQIAERYSDIPMTPGAICYFLDTFKRSCCQRKDIFPETYLDAIDAFWLASAELLKQFGARSDGFPQEHVKEDE